MNEPKPDYVADIQNHANDTPMSLALRQLQVTISGPVYWIINVAAVLLTAMAGPYFTLERMTFPERLVYWGSTIIFSTLLMTFLSIYAYRVTEARHWNWMLVSVVAGIAGILPVVGSVYLAEGLATGFADGWLDLSGFLRLTMYVAPTLIAVTMVVHLVKNLQHHEPVTAPAPPVAPAHPATPSPTLLQSKLPHHLGHDIIAVQAQDHYVEVTTTRGSAMVLMRLRDVVQDLEPLGGLQVHRSWWVNLSHVVRTDKTPSGPELVLTSDQKVLVGRSFRAKLREVMER